MGGSPNIPKPRIMPEPPKASDQAIQDIAEMEKLRRRRAGGRDSTIFAGELGAYQSAMKRTTGGV